MHRAILAGLLLLVPLLILPTAAACSGNVCVHGPRGSSLACATVRGETPNSWYSFTFCAPKPEIPHIQICRIDWDPLPPRPNCG